MNARTPPRSPRKKHGALVVVLSMVAVLLALVVVLAIAIPRLVAAKVEEAARKRALVVKYKGVGLPLGVVALHEVTIRPKATDRVSLAAPRVEAPLDGLRPSAIRIPTATITLDGPVDEVLAAVAEVRDADAKVGAQERLPLDVLAGSLAWKDLAGDDTSLRFERVVVKQRPTEGTLDVELGKGKLALEDVTIAPIELEAHRAKGGAIDATVTISADDGSAKLVAHRDDDGDSVDASFEDLPLEKIGAPQLRGVDLHKAVVTGKASGARTSEGAFRSEGKVTVSHLALPPITAGAFTFSIGGRVTARWKGVPKKGDRGVLRLEETSVEANVAGKTILVTIGGEVSIGPKGEGPYAVHLTWALPKVPCSWLVSSVGGVAVASAITGDVLASGTLDGDPSKPGKLRLGKTIDVGCGVDVAKAIPLPPGLPTIPGFP